MKNLDINKKDFTNEEVVKIVNYIVDSLVLELEKANCDTCINIIKDKQNLIKENIGDLTFTGEELLNFSQKCSNCE